MTGTAIITGAGSGIGRAIADRSSRSPWPANVALAARAAATSFLAGDAARPDGSGGSKTNLFVCFRTGDDLAELKSI